jgi:conjugative relaxase-like TrwC/TraI family protein
MVASLGKLYTAIQQYAEDNYCGYSQPIEKSFWYGQGAARLGLSGQVIPHDYNNLYDGLDPDGNPLRQQQSQRNSNPGRDITLSAHKSVSLLGLVKKDQAVIEVHHQAVKTTLSYVEQNCIFTRTGKGGTNLQQTDNAVIAVFPHEGSRNEDPQIHTHCVFFNFTQAEDGKWRAMHNTELYQQKMTIGTIYHHELGRGLEQLGYSVDWNSNGTIEVQGYLPKQLQGFSSRRADIINAVGIDADSATREKACLQTRLDKVYLNRQQQSLIKLDWHNKVEQLGISHPQPHSQSIGQARQFFNNLADNFSTFRGQNQPQMTVQQAINSLDSPDFKTHQLLRETLIQNRGKYRLDELQQAIENHPSLVQTNDGQLANIDQRSQQAPGFE